MPPRSAHRADSAAGSGRAREDISGPGGGLRGSITGSSSRGRASGSARIGASRAAIREAALRWCRRDVRRELRVQHAARRVEHDDRLVAALGQSARQRDRHLLHAAAVQVGQQQGDAPPTRWSPPRARRSASGPRVLGWRHRLGCSHGHQFMPCPGRRSTSVALQAHPDASPAAVRQPLEGSQSAGTTARTQSMKLHSNPASPYGRKVKVVRARDRPVPTPDDP